MNNLEKEFVPYSEALALKELGFDEPCLFAYYGKSDIHNFKESDYVLCGDRNNTSFKEDGRISAPLYQQAFRWFREKHGTHSLIDGAHPWFRYAINSKDNEWEGFKELDFEKCQLACLRKLIEIVKENKQ